jgi:hypothetical protein
MPDDRVEAIRERLAAATPGPWEWWPDPTGEDYSVGRPEEVPGEVGDSSQFVGTADEQADADLIANAPSDLTHLLSALSAAEGERDGLQDQFGDHGVVLGEGPDGVFSVAVDGQMFIPEARATAAEERVARLGRLARDFIAAADVRVGQLIGYPDQYFDTYHDARMPLVLLCLEDAAPTQPTEGEGM